MLNSTLVKLLIIFAMLSVCIFVVESIMYKDEIYDTATFEFNPPPAPVVEIFKSQEDKAWWDMPGHVQNFVKGAVDILSAPLKYLAYYGGTIAASVGVIFNIVTNILLLPLADLPTIIKILISTPIWVTVGIIIFIVVKGFILAIGNLIPTT